ncbi:hypothetical protein PR048_003494 [Dryococelus australis]|uniref:Uncharacterized protein n=1 Tax=Dryococelus australis TaxID=614101 RepID=A0ABQ9IPJ8_9NEOP|nr:hypothetical protein PR048_003494 [Dryococelus australis]
MLKYSPAGSLASIPGGVAPGFSHVGIVLDNAAAGKRVFSGISRFPPPHPSIPALLRSLIVSPSSAIKTSLLRATQISTLPLLQPPLFHTVFGTTWRTLAQSSPSTMTEDNQCIFDIRIFVQKTVESSLQAIELATFSGLYLLGVSDEFTFYDKPPRNSAGTAGGPSGAFREPVGVGSGPAPRGTLPLKNNGVRLLSRRLRRSLSAGVERSLLPAVNTSGRGTSLCPVIKQASPARCTGILLLAAGTTGVCSLPSVFCVPATLEQSGRHTLLSPFRCNFDMCIGDERVSVGYMRRRRKLVYPIFNVRSTIEEISDGIGYLSYGRYCPQQGITARNNEVFGADKDEMRGEWSSAGMKGRGKQEFPNKKTRRPTVYSRTIPNCENPGVNRPGTVGGNLMNCLKVELKVGAAVAERLARSPPTKANRAQSTAGLPNFRMWGSCRTMPLVGGYSRGSPVSPAPSFRRCSVLASITLIGSEDLAVKSRPNLFTHYFYKCKNFQMRSISLAALRRSNLRWLRCADPVSAGCAAQIQSPLAALRTTNLRVPTVNCFSAYTTSINDLVSPLVDDQPIMNAIKYRVMSGVVWINRTMVSSSTDTNRTGVLAVMDIVHPPLNDCALGGVLKSAPLNSEGGGAVGKFRPQQRVTRAAGTRIAPPRPRLLRERTSCVYILANIPSCCAELALRLGDTACVCVCVCVCETGAVPPPSLLDPPIGLGAAEISRVNVANRFCVTEQGDDCFSFLAYLHPLRNMHYKAIRECSVSAESLIEDGYRQQDCTPVQCFARRGDERVDTHVSVAPSAPTLLGFNGEKFLQPGGNLNWLSTGK